MAQKFLFAWAQAYVAGDMWRKRRQGRAFDGRLPTDFPHNFGTENLDAQKRVMSCDLHGRLDFTVTFECKLPNFARHYKQSSLTLPVQKLHK